MTPSLPAQMARSRYEYCSDMRSPERSDGKLTFWLTPALHCLTSRFPEAAP